MAKMYRVESWFDGVGVGGKLLKPGWQRRGSYADRKWAERASKQILREEKTQVRIVAVADDPKQRSAHEQPYKPRKKKR